MKQKLFAIWQYTKLLFKEWVLLLSLALGLVGLVAQALGVNSFLPQPLFWGIALVGFFWAGYLVYEATLAKIPGELRPETPKLVLALVEGNEYFFSFRPDKVAVSDIDRRLVSEGPFPVSDSEPV